jgi:hypothetical protein
MFGYYEGVVLFFKYSVAVRELIMKLEFSEMLKAGRPTGWCKQSTYKVQRTIYLRRFRAQLVHIFIRP